MTHHVKERLLVAAVVASSDVITRLHTHTAYCAQAAELFQRTSDPIKCNSALLHVTALLTGSLTLRKTRSLPVLRHSLCWLKTFLYLAKRQRVAHASIVL